ncbi:MAG: permease prefix domain 1-containing protein [Thermoguttaceae bacterium]|jgi:hypothetical protein
MIGGMSPEEFQNYLGLLSRLLRLKATERESIEEELRSHLEERLAALTAQGIEPARAVSMALAEFGDAAALAAEFTAVSRYYKKRWIMRLTVGSIAASIIMAAVLVSYWPGAAMQSPLNAAQPQQIEKAKETSSDSIASAIEKPDANAQTQVKLEKTIDAEFVETPLGQVLDYFSTETKAQFRMDTKILNEAGITSDNPITFHLKNMPAETILRLMFRDLNLAYWLEDGVVIVTTQDEANQCLETRFYRVNDLLDLSNEPTSMDKPITTATDSASEKNSIFASKPPAKNLRDVKEDYTVNVDNLIEVITTTIKPSTWDTVGGPASISEYRGVLIVSHTQDVHREIPKLLDKLRKLIDKSLPIVKSTYRRSNVVLQEKAIEKNNDSKENKSKVE